ncbi:MAG: hypothetical protein CME63_01505 [Halobacteriovoraceae bacterium]|nr:hypothetical protein [Halobacteriovoraceae bacterium]
MSELTFVPFSKQNDFMYRLLEKKDCRAIGAFAGKRGGKTEVGAVSTGALIEDNFARDWDSVDPYVAVISAPTYDMLKRLSWKKFQSYWKPFIKHDTKSPLEMYWWDSNEEQEKIIYGISADNPGRIEGVKASVIWIDEVFQVSEQFFLECLARTADCGGVVICTGSLGVQFVNPKQHWAYKYFKKNQFEGFACIEWASSENPHFSKDEIERLRGILDPKTFKAMFTITWDLTPKSAVYDEWSEANEITGYKYNPNLETYICIDWGWTHPMSCGFYQYDREKDHVYKFDEIFGSKIKIDTLYDEILKRPWIKTVKKTRIETAPNGEKQEIQYDFITNITDWGCDIAGNQEREQTGRSNVKHYRDKYGVTFKRRKSGILYGIAIVRSYIKNAVGATRFFVDTEKCPETIAGIKRYKFPEKDGEITNENPEKIDDDAVDETRYYFVNILDFNRKVNLSSNSVGVY